MASQVLSGASNPSYTNNTGENVRVVINYMSGTPFAPAVPRVRSAIPSSITITWAGVSVGSSWDQGNISIGRNLAYSQIFRDTQAGGTQRVQVGVVRDAQGQEVTIRDGRATIPIFESVPVNTSVALASVANNATGVVDGIPTEVMLAPGQSFSAVCSVYNIVVIPENG